MKDHEQRRRRVAHAAAETVTEDFASHAPAPFRTAVPVATSTSGSAATVATDSLVEASPVRREYNAKTAPPKARKLLGIGADIIPAGADAKSVSPKAGKLLGIGAPSVTPVAGTDATGRSSKPSKLGMGEETERLEANPKYGTFSRAMGALPGGVRGALGVKSQEKFVQPTGKFSTATAADKRAAVTKIKANEKAAEDEAAAMARAAGEEVTAPQNVPHQPVADLGEIYAHNGMLEAEFKHQVESIAKTTKGKGSFRPDAPLKAVGRSLEKIATDYGGDASRIIDVTGASIAYDTVDDLIDGYKAISEAKDLFKIVRLKNSLQKMDGYGDINMSLEMGGADFDVPLADGTVKKEHYDGFIVELQLHLQTMLDAKKKGHKQYEEQRGITARNEEAGLKDKADWTPKDRARHKVLQGQMDGIYNRQGWEALPGFESKKGDLKKRLEEIKPF